MTFKKVFLSSTCFANPLIPFGSTPLFRCLGRCRGCSELTCCPGNSVVVFITKLTNYLIYLQRCSSGCVQTDSQSAKNTYSHLHKPEEGRKRGGKEGEMEGEKKLYKLGFPLTVCVCVVMVLDYHLWSSVSKWTNNNIIRIII